VGQTNRTVRSIVLITESIRSFHAGRAYVGFVGPAQPMLKWSASCRVQVWS